MDNSKIEQLNQLLIIEPDDNFLNYCLALEFIKINELTKSKQIFEKLIINSPDYLATYYHYAKLLLKEDKDKAIKLYNEGIILAKKTKQYHSLSELQSALMEIEMEDYL